MEQQSKGSEPDLIITLTSDLKALSDSIRPFIKSSEERSKTSSNRREQLKLRSQLSLSLDEMLAVFMKLPTVTAEDKLMKEDIKNLKSYFGRIHQSDKPATQIDRSVSKRFIDHSISASSSAGYHSTGTKRNKTEEEKHTRDNLKVEGETVQLPEIRRVIKNPTVETDIDKEEDNDEVDLKVYQ
ncbi:hypothetical protein BY996DRAFT_3369153 [Phakopsora pachyrhizi]|nr:hypothetical protein BY996DRAFT_3369153 [Phakopsora pachyrhizi]